MPKKLGDRVLDLLSRLRRLLRETNLALTWTRNLVLFWVDLLALLCGIVFGGYIYQWQGVILGIALSQLGIAALLLRNFVRLWRIGYITRHIMDGHITPEDKRSEAMEFIVAQAEKERRKTARI